jgi:ubiquinone/menaquinone biosynthesis C-methylase UbiE
MVNAMGVNSNTHSKESLAERKTSLGRFEWIRFQFLKLLYDVIFLFLMRDGSWREPLFTSIAPKAQCHVLSFGRGAISVARALAFRFPEAKVIGTDSYSNPIKKVFRSLLRRDIPNLMVVEVPRCGPLPFDAGSFDKVVLVLAFHNRIPDEKLAVAKEMLRVLRQGGMLHVAAYDKPSLPGENAILRLIRYLAGPAAADPHLNGSWIEYLSDGGFAGIRRQSSCSVGGARISVVRARKP